MKLLRAITTVAGFTGLSRVFGFIRDILTAAILGAGPIADAFFVALKLPNFFRRVTAEGAFSVSFVPLYSEMLEKDGKEKASVFASNAFAMMLVILVPFTLLALMAMPYIIYAIAPGFADDPIRYDLAVDLSRITFPYLIFMSLTALLGGMLNAHNKFAPFAAAPILFNVSLILALLFFTDFSETAGHAMAYGIALAGVSQFLLLVYFVKKHKLSLTIKVPEFSTNIKKLFKLMGPGVLGAGVMHVNLLVDLIIASLLASGSISYLYYEDRLNQLPLSMIGIAVGTALLPMLSKAMTAKDIAGTQNLFNRALEISLLLSLPAAVALFTIPETLIGALFERGKFTDADTAIAATVLMGYAIGLPAYVASKIFQTAYWSQQDTMSPVKVSIIITLLNIALSLMLIIPFGVAGIAISTGIVGWLQLGLLYRGIHKNESLQLDKRFGDVVFKIVFATLIMAFLLMVSDKYFMVFDDISEIERVTRLMALVIGGMAIYGAGILATGAIKIADIKQLLLKKDTTNE
ncbi:MAG: murein biosynthesis integral membrane protein MurJ [Pseudomonadota bacterium]